MILKILLLIIPLILFTSYILFNKIYEGFANDEYKKILEDPELQIAPNSSNIDFLNPQTNEPKIIDNSKDYKDILNDLELQTEPQQIITPLKYKKKSPVEIEYPYSVDLPNKGINLKDLNTSNLPDISLYEQSVDMQLESHMYNDKINIDDPISDAYLPYSQNIYDNKIKTPEQVNIEYTIISIFKSVLSRNPSRNELEKYLQQFQENEIDETLLRINLLNSTEYKRNIKLQSNDVFSDIEYTVAKEDLLSYIVKLYFEELNVEPPKTMLLPLRDIYMYLQSNEYLFRALLIHNNYKKFEEEIIETKLLTKLNLANLFNKYFILYDLRLKANDIKKTEILARKPIKENNTEQSSSYEISQIQPVYLPNIKKFSITDIIEIIKNQVDTGKIINDIIKS